MRYKYIIGILLLLAIGFLVYFYWDTLSGTTNTTEGFVVPSGIYQLYEQRCTMAVSDLTSTRCNADNKDIGVSMKPNDPLTNQNEFYPTVSKTRGRDLCRVNGGRMATYDELNRAVVSGSFTIDAKTPAMVIDSDKTYSSSDKKLIFTQSVSGFTTHNQRVCHRNKYQLINKDVATDSLIWNTLRTYELPYTAGPNCGGGAYAKQTAFDYDGYPVTTKNNDGVTTTTNASDYYCDWSGDFISGNYAGDIKYGKFNPPASAQPEPTYGNPVCFGPVPTPSSFQINFPSIAGRGWANIKSLVNGDGTLFTREFQVRKGTEALIATCTEPTLVATPMELVNTSLPMVDVNATTLSAPVSTYKILDLDAVYTQIDIAKVDLPKRRDDVRTDESSNTPSSIIAEPSSCDLSFLPLDDSAAVGLRALNAKNSALNILNATNNEINDPNTPSARKNYLQGWVKPAAQTEYDNALAKYNNDNAACNDSRQYTQNSSWTNATGKRIRNGYQVMKAEANAGSAAISNLQADFAATMRTLIPYYDPLGTFASSNSNKAMTATQFANILLKNIDDYYAGLLLAIETHPIAFLRKGVINFPSLLNVMKVYDLGPPTPQYVTGTLRESLYWTLYGNQKVLPCVDYTENHYYNDPIAGQDTNTKYSLNHNPGGNWCRATSPLNVRLSCDGGLAWSGWNVSCVKEYWRRWEALTDADYTISIQARQLTFESQTVYQQTLGTGWAPVGDAGNPILASGTPPSPVRNIPVTGTMSPTNMTEINTSISLALCFNFTDTSTLETQIRISSAIPNYLYMSPDASALREFMTKIDTTASTSTLTPLNSAHNNVHCPILVTTDYFFCIPYHARKIMYQWASSRYTRVKAWSTPLRTAGSAAPTWQSGSTSPSDYVIPFLSATATGLGSPSTDTRPVNGSFFNTTITDEIRHAVYDSMAAFYYHNETSGISGTSVSGSESAQAIISKIVDVFQIGNTVFDVRFEENRRRSKYFTQKLAELDADYKRYRAMNLSKDDQIELERRYILDKTDLYKKDSENIWGTSQDCGITAQYVIINTDTAFHLSQIVVINSAGQNVALGASVYNARDGSFTSPNNLDYGSTNDDPRTKKFYNSNTGDELTDSSTLGGQSTTSLATARANAISNLKSYKESLLTDGEYKQRWYPTTYRTRSDLSPNTKQLILDLGQSQDVSVVRLILPKDGSTANYTVSLSKSMDASTSSSTATVPISGVLENANTTIKFSFVGTGLDAATCPALVYERFKVARFYTMYTPSATPTAANPPWKVTGYSTGVAAALTFDPKYNAGIHVDLTVNGGNVQPPYRPSVVYDLNLGGSQNAPVLTCSDPTQIANIFKDYNLLVNSYAFRQEVNKSVLNETGQNFTAITVKQYRQLDENRCAYVWTDKAVDTTGAVTSRERQGTFSYPFDTENWNAYERVLDISGTSIYNGQGAIGYTPLYSGSGSGSGSQGIAIPEMYKKSVTLDTAGGFCPALPCSDIQVMQSILNTYNANLAAYGGTAAISKIHKAITPSSNQCEYLVETVGGGSSLSKVLFDVIVSAPATARINTDPKNPVYNDTCLWRANKPGKWGDSNVPDLVDSTPNLTRVYNYALDIMRPFATNVTNVVSNLTSLGNAQLDGSASGIVNALLQYRTETAAAAGDIRYFDDTDEFGNRCVATTAGSYSSANYPRCRSATILNSLYSYYATYNPLSIASGTTSRIQTLLRAGMTDDGQCDYTFSRSDYSDIGQVIGTRQPTQSTSGLRCQVSRIPFSCNYEVTSCTPVNPTPTIADVEAIPSKFVPNMTGGSGSSSSGSNPPPITAAGLLASGSQSLQQPVQSLLRSVDYIDCISDYARVLMGQDRGPPAAGVPSTAYPNYNLIQCGNGSTFGKIGTSLLYTLSTPPVIGTGTELTKLMPIPSGGLNVSLMQTLIPFTIVDSKTISLGVYEFRITQEDTLPFEKTYMRASFYYDFSLGGTIQLASLAPSDPSTSQYAFLYTTPDTAAIQSLANTFITYWNGIFTQNNNIGNKIGSITGYFLNRATDSIVFRATSATFGSLGVYDVQYFYPTAYYTVTFRKRYVGATTFIYKVSPLPSENIGGTSGSSGSAPPGYVNTDISVPASVSDGYIVQSPQAIMNLGYYRAFRFTVTAVAQDAPGNPRSRAEIARIYFYSSSTGGSGSAPTTMSGVNISNATVSIDGVPASYPLPSTETQCKPNYDKVQNVVYSALYDCVPNAATIAKYPAVLDTELNNGSYLACGIGYYLNGTNCVSSGYFQEVLNSSLITTNKFVPRLRFNVNQAVLIDFNQISPTNTFSFVLGSKFNRPLQWKLEGSINKLDWQTVYNQTTNFTYPSTGLLSFYNPGFFKFSTPSSASSFSVSSPTNQVAQYSQMSAETIEGFTSPDPTKKRLRQLRWRILETQLPTAPYVHASRLQFHTKAGVVPATAIRISNPHGTRHSPSDGPTALLSDSGRWVDYNKSELLITLDLAKLPGNPVYGFQFAVPPEIPNSIDFFPARWLLEGSYDGRTWIPLHDKADKAHVLGTASPIYKFSQQI